jgi:Flp pilus assembly protein TadG
VTRSTHGNRQGTIFGTLGVASVEFGIISPVLIIFLMAIVDLSQAVITLHRLNTVVQQTGLMATQLSVQPDQSTTLTVAQLNLASSVIYSVMPQTAKLAVYNAKTNPVPAYAVVVSDIVYSLSGTNTPGCAAGLNCTSYNANLAWSVPLQYGQQITRACGVVTQNTAGQPTTYVNNLPSTVPTSGIASSVSTLVVDVVYNFTPIFARFIGPVTMRQTAFFNQRSIIATYITYNTGNETSGGTICQGYS